MIFNFFRQQAKKLAFRLRYNYPVTMLAMQFTSLRPRTLNQHVLHHMAFGRDPNMRFWSDKLAVRDWAAARFEDLNFPKLYQVVETGEDLSFKNLPEQFVVKVNHASGTTILVSKAANPNEPMRNVFVGRTARFLPILVHPSQFDAELAKRTIASWLGRKFYYRPKLRPEWAYRGIVRKAFIEEYLEVGDKPAFDVKLMMSRGKVIYCSRHESRYQGHQQDLFDENWVPIDVAVPGTVQSKWRAERPEFLAQMIRIAKEVSANVEVVRVDFYEANSKLYLGEITNYPMQGNLAFEPPIWDLRFGQKI